MATQTQISPEDFVAIAGDVTIEDAEKYLKMGKYNLELALNYYFNKKDKSIKPLEEPAKPLTLLQKLQEGGKKQEKFEKFVKDLSNGSTRYKKSTENNNKKLPGESQTKKQSTSSIINHSQPQSQKTSNKKTVEKNSGNKGTNSAQKKSSETKTPEAKVLLSNFFGSFAKENKKPVTPSTGTKEIIEEDKFEEKEGSMSMNMIIENSFQSNGLFNHSNSNKLDFGDYKHSNEEIKDLEEQVILQFNRQSSLAIEVEANETHTMEEERIENNVITTTGSTTKNFKRNFMKFASMHDLSNEEKTTEGTEQRSMVIESPVKLEGWPKFLGNMQVKASVISSLKTNAQQGDSLELKLEKSTIVEKKKGPRSKAGTSVPPAIIRVLYQGQEIGKLDTIYAVSMSPLLEREYVLLEASLAELPSSWATFSTFWINVQVNLLPKAISRPLTKVYSSQDNLSVEDEIILNELKHTQEAFINLFTTLGIQCVTPTLIKRSVEKPSPVQTQGSGTMKGENFVSETQKGEKSKETIETEEEQQQNSNNDQNLDYERKLFQLLLSEENLSCEDLEPSELFHALSLDLSPDFAKSLAWMLLREGNNEKGRESLYEKKRKLHPLWEEYKLSDESLLYFNPFTGQLCIEMPKSSQDCSGGIVANMDPQERIEIMAELIYTNIYDKEMKNDLSALNSKKKNLTFSQGRNSLSNAMKESLPPAKTLIIVPVSSLYFWESSLSRFSREDNPLKLLVYYGQKRSQEFQNLGMFDIVLTTYGIISGEFTGDGKRDLYNYDWFRVVLDEAHYIKGKRIQTTKAIEELNILHRWCLSSLTLQNRLEDLYNMVSFLKLEPWSNLTWWNVHLSKPLEKGDQNAFDVMKTILGPVMLNLHNELCVGKKVTKSSQLMVQERKYRIEYVQLTKKELDYYVCLFQKSKTEFDKFIGQDALIENYTQAIELVVRIRQACDHLFLIYSKFEVKDSDCLENEIAGFFGTGNSDEEYHKRGLNDLNVLDEKSLKYKFHDHFEIIMDENTRTEQVIAIQKPQALVSIDIIHETVERLNMGDIVHCPLCLNDLENAVVTICGHILCSVCMKRSIMAKSMCPVCNTILTRKDCLVISRKISFVFDISENYRRSAKIEAIMKHITEAINSNKKCVVFSHFHPMILLLEHDLELNNINFLKIDAAMHEEERIMRIQQFNACTDTLVLLSTIVVGDIRTEKLITDIVLLAEPSNDEALEQEALQSVQADEPENQVEIVKFICKDTIEEKIIELGQKKRDNPEYKSGVTPEEKIYECLEDLCYLMKTN